MRTKSLNVRMLVKATVTLSRGLAAFLAVVAMQAPAKAQQVWIGSGSGWGELIAHPEQWNYVRHNAAGFYVNFIEMLHTNAAKCAQMSAGFTNKQAYYESDSRNTGLGGFPNGGQFGRDLQASEMQALLDGGFTIPIASLNYGIDDGKLKDITTIGLPAGQTRPCLGQGGPWTFGGDLAGNNPSAVDVRKYCAETDGLSTDGPLSLWQNDSGHMQAGSFEMVRYAHSQGKTAAVMVAPYNLKPDSQWLTVAQQCVRAHEDAGAVPNIWIVFSYAMSTPTVPESVNGQPADTITGVAYWLLHHVDDPDHSASIGLSAPASVRTTALTTPSDTVSVPMPSRFGDGASNVIVSNSSTWLDLAPTVTAKVTLPAHVGTVRFVIDGQDVTDAITSPQGLSFVRTLRLWPGQSRTIQVIVDRRNAGFGAATRLRPVAMLTMRPNPAS